MTQVTQAIHPPMQCLGRPCNTTRITTAALGALLLVAGIALLAATSGSYFYVGIACSAFSLIPLGISCLMKSTAEDPTDVQHEQPATLDAPEALAKAPSLLVNPRQALEVMQSVVHWPDDRLKEKDTCLVSIAEAFLKANDKAGAREAIKLIYGTCPEKEPFLVKLARVHLEQGELEDALATARQIFRLKEEKHALQSAIVDAWIKNGDLDKASNVIETTFDGNHKTPLRLRLILAYLNKPDLQAGRTQMQRVHSVPEGFEPQLVEIAQAFLKQKEYADASRALDLIRAENTSKEALLWKLAQAYFDQGSEEGVQNAILCVSEKKRLELRLHFAGAYLEAGKKEQAVRLICSEKGEQRDTLILAVAKAYLSEGDEAKALLTLHYLAFSSQLNQEFLAERLQDTRDKKRILQSVIAHAMRDKITQNRAYSQLYAATHSLPETQQQKIRSARDAFISQLVEQTSQAFERKLKEKGAKAALEWIKTEVTQQKHILPYLAVRGD